MHGCGSWQLLFCPSINQASDQSTYQSDSRITYCCWSCVSWQGSPCTAKFCKYRKCKCSYRLYLAGKLTDHTMVQESLWPLAVGPEVTCRFCRLCCGMVTRLTSCCWSWVNWEGSPSIQGGLTTATCTSPPAAAVGLPFIICFSARVLMSLAACALARASSSAWSAAWRARS